ncbi:MAG TPA: DegT/DnrJ/EryC1/StrS family aminotransferase [Planctomycetota bacterium]|nr:DegT/DnrJ/EryC1/StrS family aminotransferase [Planctomycetota bacterium]HRR79884.1 DegT/DnrJ/EryC1/StrS family aminotransferase [Planctomycetota bacterium]HRT95510.1 DegT/DnrJ/EryC1/StrS family aminotransferase [Planctomycetota bacterium]
MAMLAIKGGPPVRTRPFPPRRPFGDREVELTAQAIRSQNLFGPGGTMVPELEHRFAALYGMPHAVACTSGTAAIHTALGALALEPGDEVITAPITDAGTVAPILFQNCVPVFADTDATLNIAPRDVEAKITPRTRAVLAVHLFGNPCDLDALADIARRHGIALIEDCCQAHLTDYNGRLCGTVGNIGCFSLQQSKHMTCGDGGLTITRDPALAERMALFRDKGWPRRPGARGYVMLGLNYRMTELQAAVALAQLERVGDVVRRRNELGSLLTERIRHAPGVAPAPVTSGGRHTYWLYPLRITGHDPARFAEALRAEGIPCGHGYTGKPIYLCMEALVSRRTFGASAHPLDGCHGGRRIDYVEGLCPHTEAALREVVTLGLHEQMEPADIADMAAGVIKVAEGFDR